ncbi:MAG: nitroreductase, partial [Armatimonadetes bacterium]|nr:nitroreductase [Armatimonadota bacterium]
MNRRTMIGGVGGALVVAGTTAYFFSDRENLSRADIKPEGDDGGTLAPDEARILLLASLAPSGHNTQPWFVEAVAPYHFVIGNDNRRWLPAVDPNQRETVLSLGAFVQNLEYAANDLGYVCRWNLLATTNQHERVIEVKLAKSTKNPFDAGAMESRRTVRSHFLGNALTTKDVAHLVDGEPDFVHYLPTGSKESGFINEQTIEANRLQSHRDPAQRELANWIRFSSENAGKHRDGLTTASMEIEGVSGFVVRNFYGERDVMKADFRKRGIDQVVKVVWESAVWIVITSADSSVAALLDTGRRMELL